MSYVKPRVSIGVPVYNGENFLAEALDSLLAQTFPDFEIIISDNGSTDTTEAICRSYAARDQRIRYYRQKENLGASKNFNFTFEKSAGEFFKWAAHDDVLVPTFLEQCIRILDSYPTVVVSYPQTLFIDGDSIPQDHYADHLHLRSKKPYERFHQFFANPGWCHPVFGLIRTDVLRKTPLIGNYPRSDRNLIGELALHGEIYEIPQPLFLRRLHPQISTEVNTTERALAAWFDPKKKGKRVFPRWRRFYEYLRAITHAPLNGSERIRCYVRLFQFVVVPSKWGGLFDDLFGSTKLAPLSVAALAFVVLFGWLLYTVPMSRSPFIKNKNR
ncbi:MAG: glycosyltransferase family 2 protein [Anaerolineae bacterium]|nr:glycosyltransferase family 2 protein [Anaerolineae bacterium]